MRFIIAAIEHIPSNLLHLYLQVTCEYVTNDTEWIFVSDNFSVIMQQGYNGWRNVWGIIAFKTANTEIYEMLLNTYEFRKSLIDYINDYFCQ